MTTAQAGDTVQIHYTGTLTDGTQFDSSEGRDPLGFVLGSGQIIAGLDAAIVGMAEGESKTVTIPAEQAYGAIDPNQMQEVPRDSIPAEIPLEVGQRLQAQTEQGGVIVLTVTAVSDATVTLDANHALAGKDLVFAFTVVSIQKA